MVLRELVVVPQGSHTVRCAPAPYVRSAMAFVQAHLPAAVDLPFPFPKEALGPTPPGVKRAPPSPPPH